VKNPVSKFAFQMRPAALHLGSGVGFEAVFFGRAVGLPHKLMNLLYPHLKSA
jgi:hypothetical protein